MQSFLSQHHQQRRQSNSLSNKKFIKNQTKPNKKDKGTESAPLLLLLILCSSDCPPGHQSLPLVQVQRRVMVSLGRRLSALAPRPHPLNPRFISQKHTLKNLKLSPLLLLPLARTFGALLGMVCSLLCMPNSLVRLFHWTRPSWP